MHRQLKLQTPKLALVSPRPQGNRLLAALVPSEHPELFSKLELVMLERGLVLREADQAPRFVYFPVDAVVSEMYVMADGASVQVAIIGYEGLVGLSVLIGGKEALSSESVIGGGYAYRLPRDVVEREFSRSPAMQKAVLCYTQALLTQMSQTAVCNRHHAVDQQLCRWLLLVLDRMYVPELHITQELIGVLLGVRREGITTAAGKLQAAGIISYRRGCVTVVDRAAMERRCCECYGVIKREFDRVLPKPLDAG